MKIVQVITSAEWGGAQRHVYDLSRGLRDLGHDVTVLYGIEGRLHQRLDEEGISVARLPSLTRNIRPWRDFMALSLMRAEIERWNPDVVHVHSSKAGTLVRLAMRKSHIPVVYTIHGLVYLNSRMPAYKKFIYRQIELALLPLAKATITVSKRDLEELEGRGAAKKTQLVHIPNGIDPFPEPIPLPEEPIIGTVARFTEEKALDILLKAVAEVRKHVPNVRLILVGDGPLRGDLEKLAKDLAIEDITLFAGFQENVVEWLGKMRVFALTSVKEGMPYALLEAINSGRMVVTTTNGGTFEYESGLVEMTSPQVVDVSEAIKKWLLAPVVVDPSSRGFHVDVGSMCELVMSTYQAVAKPRLGGPYMPDYNQRGNC